jgi:hypothetical protein
MALVSPHTHQLKRYRYRNQLQWNCLVPFCKFSTRNALDLLGGTFQCTKCKNYFIFDESDIKNQTLMVNCAVCNGDTIARQIEVKKLNELAQKEAITLLGKEVSDFPVMSSVDMDDLDADIIPELIKAELEKERDKENNGQHS